MNLDATIQLRELLQVNDVNENDFASLLFDTLITGVFEIMVDRIETNGDKLKVLRYYRNTEDEKAITANLVGKYVGAKLTPDTLARINELMLAYLAKSDARAPVPDERRKMLLEKQDGLCAICKRGIDECSSHYDHIVAFKYVGDELHDNYQMLCEKCNHEKGASAYYRLSRILCSR